MVIYKTIHETMFGISSDLFVAVVDDVDHWGITNKQLVNNKDPLALDNHGKCVTDQHSVQLAWNILMEDQYTDLRCFVHLRNKRGPGARCASVSKYNSSAHHATLALHQKWNQRLFDDRYMAYVNGKDDEDPSTGWYQGELWFIREEFA